MIVIRTIEDLEAEQERQFNAWIDAGKEERKFYLSFEGADLEEAKLSGADFTGAKLTKADLRGADLSLADLSGAKIKDTIITKSQYDELYRLYSHEVMAGFERTWR